MYVSLFIFDHIEQSVYVQMMQMDIKKEEFGRESIELKQLWNVWMERMQISMLY